MTNRIRMAFLQAREALKDGGWKNLARKRVFFGRIAVPVEMDLTAPASPDDPFAGGDLRFLELTPSDLATGRLRFAVPSRGLKASVNLRRGWRGFALVREGVVLGDIWCWVPGRGGPDRHKDLPMLGIAPGGGEAYAFDMLIDPTFRGKNLAVPIQKSLHAALRRDGYHRVYGFYWKDNLPALWMHRMLKFREHPTRRVSRFFFLHSSSPAR